jgi:hypothetical protein
MSRPRNNLEALQLQVPPQQKSSPVQSSKVCSNRPSQASHFLTQSQPDKPSKFKPAKTSAAFSAVGTFMITAWFFHSPVTSSIPSPVAHWQRGVQQLPSFSSPGYGEQEPPLPASAALHTHSRDEVIDISPSDMTSPISVRSTPSKRSSSDLAPSPHVPPKRLRSGKKERGRQSPPSQDHTLCAPDHSFRATYSSSVVHSPVLQVEASRLIATASRPFEFTDYHLDLEHVRVWPS